jgi:hypothetical protein
MQAFNRMGDECITYLARSSHRVRADDWGLIHPPITADMQ